MPWKWAIAMALVAPRYKKESSWRSCLGAEAQLLASTEVDFILHSYIYLLYEKKITK